MPEVDLNGTFLCVSAYTGDEYPVEYFDVEVIDDTGKVTNLSGIPTTNGTLCQPITFCSPWNVSVSATNSIGTSKLLEVNSTTFDQGIMIIS